MKSLYSILFIILLISCSNETKVLLGTWTNEATGGNQTFIFKKDSIAFWIFQNEASEDTIAVSYKTNFIKKPSNLDLSGFEKGPLKNKTLYGIIEIQKKQTFLFDCEPGESNYKGMKVRPQRFNPEQTQTFKKVKK